MAGKAWRQHHPACAWCRLLYPKLARGTHRALCCSLPPQPPQQRGKKLAKLAVGGAAGVVVVGGVVAGLTFGSLAATAANLPVEEAMQVIDLGAAFQGMGGGGDCCGGDCGGCDGCECGDCAVC